MNDNLKDTLASVLEKAMDVAERTGNWALEMAPELIQQYLMWELYSSLFFVILGSIIFLIGLTFALKVAKGKGERPDLFESEYDDGVNSKGIFYVLVSLCGTIVGGIMVPVNLYNVIFVLVAPEIYLIQKLMS